MSRSIAQQPDCDPLLPTPENHPQPYEPNDQTCEGIYIQEVSATSIISLAIFTEGASSKSLLAGPDVKMSWKTPEPLLDLKIRAQGIKRKLYYRMDTRIASQNAEFTWKTSIVERLSISLIDIGLTAWIPDYYEGIDRLFIPLRLSQENVDDGNVEKYTVAIMPSQELNELSYSLSVEDNEIKPLEPLGYGYYPNDRPIVFTIDKGNLVPGKYMLHLVAEPSNGSSRPLDIWFYHAGTP